jgi:hypothetical protein
VGSSARFVELQEDLLHQSVLRGISSVTVNPRPPSPSSSASPIPTLLGAGTAVGSPRYRENEGDEGVPWRGRPHGHSRRRKVANPKTQRVLGLGNR